MINTTDMTLEELNRFISATYRDFNGVIDQDALKIAINKYGKHLNSVERYSLYGQLVYNPKYDMRLTLDKNRINVDDF